MSTAQPIPLSPIPTAPGTLEFQDLLTWPFAQQPFYVGQVKRLLQADIPHRIMYGYGRIWVYRDPAGNTVGFGTLDLCRDYGQFTHGQLHSYIPLLAVHPAHEKRGHGRSIVEHLVAEAAVIARFPNISDTLFLDVYAANTPAISLYSNKCGFLIMNPSNPIPDPDENNELYVVMAKKVVAGPAGSTQPRPTGQAGRS